MSFENEESEYLANLDVIRAHYHFETAPFLAAADIRSRLLAVYFMGNPPADYHARFNAFMAKLFGDSSRQIPKRKLELLLRRVERLSTMLYN